MKGFPHFSRLIFAVAVSFALNACSDVMGDMQDDVRKQFQVQPGGRLILETDLGAIEVSTAAEKHVDVQIQRQVKATSQGEVEEVLRNLTIDFRQEGNEVYVRAKYRGHGMFWQGDWHNRLQLRFVVTVPRQFNLDLSSAGGSIQVSDLDGNIVSRTSGGGLRFGNVAGTVSGHASGGSIALEDTRGPVDVETSGGSIRIGRSAGPVHAHTSGGSIHVEEVKGDIHASTSGGSVTATITEQPVGNCELTTSGGSIHVNLRRNFNLELQAHTSGGRVSTDIPVTVSGEVGHNQLRGRMNAGGPLLRLETSGGGITIGEVR